MLDKKLFERIEKYLEGLKCGDEEEWYYALEGESDILILDLYEFLLSLKDEKNE